jgi:hypothetical protein
VESHFSKSAKSGALGGVSGCHKCNQKPKKHYRVKGRTAYACEICGNHIYPLAGTIFEYSSRYNRRDAGNSVFSSILARVGEMASRNPVPEALKNPTL